MPLPARQCLCLPWIAGGVFSSSYTKSINHSNMALHKLALGLRLLTIPFLSRNDQFFATIP